MTRSAVYAAVCLILLSAPALAVGPVIDYGSFSGPTVTFGDPSGTGVTEQTQTAFDPDVLYGAPLLLGDQLLFFPTQFGSSTTGGGSDSTESLLSMQITGNGPLDAVSMISLTDFGDTVLSGTGTNATATTVSLTGKVTVLEDIFGPIVPVVINFSGTFGPTDAFDLPTNPGATNWSGNVMIDVASVIPNATVVVLELTNLLTSNSEVSSSATITKKVVSGPVVAIEVLPEPVCDL